MIRDPLYFSQYYNNYYRKPNIANEYLRRTNIDRDAHLKTNNFNNKHLKANNFNNDKHLKANDFNNDKHLKANNSNNDKHLKANDFCKETEKKDSSSPREFFEIIGLKLYFDDILLICLIFFLFDEGVEDQWLYICLVLLLLS